MALTKGTGAPRKRRHWAWMRVGYTSKPASGGGKAHTTRGKPVYKWVRVGTPFYQTLRSKGIAPAMVKTGRQPRRSPGGAYIGKGGNSLDIGNTVKPGSPKGGPSLEGVKTGTGHTIKGKGGGQLPGGKNGGGGGGRRKKRGHGVSSARASGQTQRAISAQLGKTKVGQRLGGGYAENLAGLQYDAPINDLKTLIARLGPKNQQAINDITQWYGDVSTLNARAGDRAGQIAEDVAGRQDTAVQGLMAALGGGANAANTQIAAAQANDGAYQRVLGGIQEQYHADMDPILAHAEASAKEREQRLNLTQMQDYQMQLAELLGQRGQAKAANQMQVDQYNNELAQQWFQNKLAKLNANLGAQAAGVDMAYKSAQLRQQRQESKRAGGAQNVWRRMNPAQRDELLQRATGAYQKADGTVGYSRTMKQAQAWLSGVLKSPVGSGKNPGLLTMLYQYYN